MSDTPGARSKDRVSTLVEAYVRERLLWDTFSRDETDTWGTTETTSAVRPWTASGGSPSDFFVSDGTGKISLGTVDVARQVTAGSDIGDVELTVPTTIPVVMTGDTCHVHVRARYVDASNYYSLLAVFDTASTVDLHILRVIGGIVTFLATVENEIAYAAGSTAHLRFQVYGTSLGAALKGRTWLSTGVEPDTWTIEATDNSPTLASGQVGIRATLAAANSNTLPVVLSFGDVTASTPPGWVDVTRRVLAPNDSGSINGSVGRATELSDINPSTLSFTLLNHNGWFTPDNAVSPYWPDWKTGTPIRWSETIGARRFAFPDTWLEIGEVALSFEAQGSPERTDRVLNMSCVDLLTRFNRAPRFVANLAEHIKYEATSGALRAYWPMTDPAGSTHATSVGPVTQDPLRFEQSGSFQPAHFVDSLIDFGADGVPYDDGTACEFTPLTYATRGRLGTTSVRSVDPTANQFVTLLAWIYAPASGVVPSQLVLIRNLSNPPWLIFNGSADRWLLQAATDGDFVSLTGPQIEFGRWHLLGAQMDLSDGSHELWVDGSVTPGTMAAGGISTAIDRCVIDGGGVGYRIAHVQVYVGDADVFTHNDFLAQHDIGMNGWAKQRVDERIRMICNYAGIPDGQLDLEESDSLIQPPAFAGQRPGALASAAATTGGGILFTRGSELVYHDRKHRFNL